MLGRNSRDLASRENRLAARMGVDLALSAFHGKLGGPNFGRERAPQTAPRGSTFGRDYSRFGRDYTQFGADAVSQTAAAADLHPAEVAQIVRDHVQATAHTRSRKMILEPNEGSNIQVQRYVGVAMSQDLTLGTATTLDMSRNPQVKFRGQRVSMNAPEEGFAYINAILVANVNAISGTTDAFDFNARATDGAQLDLPTIDPSNSISIGGSYSGDLAGRTGTFKFTASVRGPANVAG